MFSLYLKMYSYLHNHITCHNLKKLTSSLLYSHAPEICASFYQIQFNSILPSTFSCSIIIIIITLISPVQIQFNIILPSTFSCSIITIIIIIITLISPVQIQFNIILPSTFSCSIIIIIIIIITLISPVQIQFNIILPSKFSCSIIIIIITTILISPVFPYRSMFQSHQCAYLQHKKQRMSSHKYTLIPRRTLRGS